MRAGAIANPPYAGGHCEATHVDVGALRQLEFYGCRSLLDVGCGPGGMVRAARERGWRALGIDVDLTLYRRPGIALADLTVQPVILPAAADVVWSVEVAEHIPPEATDNYLTTLTQNANKFLVVTANQKPGPLHINCHPIAWWRERLEAKGMVAMPELLQRLLHVSTMDREFLRETGQVYGWPQGVV